MKTNEEILKEVKKVYLDWYNTDLDEGENSVETLYKIGELIKDIEVEK